MSCLPKTYCLAVKTNSSQDPSVSLGLHILLGRTHSLLWLHYAINTGDLTSILNIDMISRYVHLTPVNHFL